MIAYSSSGPDLLHLPGLRAGEHGGSDRRLLSDSGPRHDQVHDFPGGGGDDPRLRRPLLGGAAGCGPAGPSGRAGLYRGRALPVRTAPAGGAFPPNTASPGPLWRRSGRPSPPCSGWRPARCSTPCTTFPPSWPSGPEAGGGGAAPGVGLERQAGEGDPGGPAGGQRVPGDRLRPRSGNCSGRESPCFERDGKLCCEEVRRCREVAAAAHPVPAVRRAGGAGYSYVKDPPPGHLSPPEPSS